MQKIKILFVCHGNICRSPMAELVMKELVRRQGLAQQILVESAATSTEEIGNPIHRGTVRRLQEAGIPLGDHRAVQMTQADYGQYDYLLGMDSRNVENMRRIAGSGEKISRLLDFTDHPRDIADPWYSGNFDQTYCDVIEGCEALLGHVCEKYGWKGME